MPKFSILHVSDLHKMDGTTYESLLQSLLTDRDSYVAAGVLSPSYVVISGDLIKGGSTDEEIQNQYSEVKQFLESLTNQFLEGISPRSSWFRETMMSVFLTPEGV